MVYFSITIFTTVSIASKTWFMNFQWFQWSFSVTMTKAFAFSLLRPQVYQSCSEVLLSCNSPSLFLTKDTSINIQTFAERHQNALKMYNTHQTFNKCFYISKIIYLPEFEPGEKRFCLFMSYSNKSLSIYVHMSVTSFESPILKQESIAFCFCLLFNVKSGLPHIYNWSCVSYCFYP